MKTANLASAIVTIPKEKLATLPSAHFQGEVVVIEDERDVEPAVEELRREGLIGFDTETRPSFKKGHFNKVSLIQLSTHTKCFLFRINITGLSQPIVDLLEDPQVVKIGLSTHDDFHNLNKLRLIHPDGFVELQNFVKNFRIADNSLTRIFGILFGMRVSKGQRLTNWEAEHLSPAQQSYAALDAWACIRIFEHLKSGAFNPLESPFLTIPDPPEQSPAN